jgi:uncharacterized protein (TIGR02271 family)
MTRTVTAMFNDRAAADAAASQLTRELGLGSHQISIYAADTTLSDTTTAGHTGETGFWASLKDLFVPDEDRYAYAEGIRRGGTVLSAEVQESNIDEAMNVLEQHGAVDLDAQEAEWRQSGWTGHQVGATEIGSTADTTAMSGLGATTTAGMTSGTTSQTAGMSTASHSGMATTAQTGSEEVIPIVEEQLRVGKRDVERGRVRVRSYVVETPVTEQVTLREEHVEVHRRAVDRPVTDADRVFQDRTIEATEHREEAVVSKEARVMEEVVIHKDADSRTETVQDTVRRTEVDIDDTTERVEGTGTTTGSASNPPGTVASRTADKALGTNISGTNPDPKV